MLEKAALHRPLALGIPCGPDSEEKLTLSKPEATCSFCSVSPVSSTDKATGVPAGKGSIFKGSISISTDQAMKVEFVAEK